MSSLNDLLLFTVIGRILLFVWMEFPLPSWLEDNKYIGGWHKCDLCGGTILYPILFLIFGIDGLHLVGLPYILIMGEIITGVLTSFAVHIIVLGWKQKFESFVIE